MSEPTSSLSGLKAVAFDAYGTLFDVHAPTARLAGEIGPSAALVSELWRQKQVQYTWLRSLMGDYADFWQVTRDALDHALEAHGIDKEGLRDKLLALCRDLDAYYDAAPTLQALHERGIATAILSNGSPDMLEQAVAHAGINHLLDHVLSVDQVRVYKPDPRTYQLAVNAFGLAPAQIGFVSANGWDAAGAAHFGLAVCQVNRFSHAREHLPARPLTVINSLSGFADLLAPAA